MTDVNVFDSELQQRVKNDIDYKYLTLLNHILTTGRKKKDRTGTGTMSVFDYTIDFDMAEGFPLLTTKEVWFKGVLHEVLWFLKGGTNIQYLVQNGVNIWNSWPYEKYKKYAQNLGSPDWEVHVGTDESFKVMSMEEYARKIADDDVFARRWGEVGKVYGAQWLKWTDVQKRGIHHFVVNELNQLDKLIDDLKNNPDSRRIMVTAWNPAEIADVLLPSCHYLFQMYSEELTDEERMDLFEDMFPEYDMYDPDMLDTCKIPKRRLSLKWNIRSCDVFLGGSWDVASYGILLILLAHVTNHVPHRLISSFGDAHLYLNHLDQAKQQLTKDSFILPKLKINRKVKSIYDFKYEDFELVNYKNAGKIKAPISV